MLSARIRSVVLICLFLLFLIADLLLVVSTLFRVSQFFESDERSPSISYDYQLTEFDHALNKTKKSFVRITRKLGKEEFISYQSGDRFFVITNFAQDEYSCTGKCFCENSGRRNVGVVTKGMIVLMSAVTSIMAVKIASNYFKEECKKVLSGMCAIEDSIGEVEDCEITRLAADEMEVVRWRCEGYCLAHHRLKKKPMVDLAQEFNCEQYRMEQGVFVEDKVGQRRQLEAKWEFLDEFLKDFCEEVSQQALKKYIKEKRLPEASKVKLCYASSKMYNIKCIEAV